MPKKQESGERSNRRMRFNTARQLEPELYKMQTLIVITFVIQRKRY